jgi:hypothetical protein
MRGRSTSTRRSHGSRAGSGGVEPRRQARSFLLDLLSNLDRCFQASKSEVGLDQHQVRKWTSWYRYTTLVMLAHALLAVIAAQERQQPTAGADDLIPLTVNEIRHLFTKLITNTARAISYWLHWSTWRRRHQQRALTSHYRRRGAQVDRHPSRNDPGLEY